MSCCSESYVFLSSLSRPIVVVVFDRRVLVLVLFCLSTLCRDRGRDQLVGVVGCVYLSSVDLTLPGSLFVVVGHGVVFLSLHKLKRNLPLVIIVQFRYG